MREMADMEGVNENKYIIMEDKDVLVEQAENITLTQQSAMEASTEEGGGELSEEELIDYDEDPMITEKLEMAEIGKRVEIRIDNLMKESAINIKVEGRDSVEKEESGHTNSSMGAEDEEEIDWELIRDSFGTKEG
jgi:hypothetical protein